MAAIQKSIFSFLNKLKTNNNRDWMTEHKKEYQSNEKLLKQFYGSVEASLNITDEISKLKVFRINRDLRFSKDKTPYNTQPARNDKPYTHRTYRNHKPYN